MYVEPLLYKWYQLKIMIDNLLMHVCIQFANILPEIYEFMFIRDFGL